jgi:hypothetical protein
MPPIRQLPQWAAATTRASHPVGYALAGFALCGVVVLAGGQVGTVPVTIPLTTWFGLLSRGGYVPGQSPAWGLVLVAAVAGLGLLWLSLLRAPTHMTERQVWTLAAAWSAPLVLGPPLLSSDVYTYAAQGLMVERGLDPYSVGPSALGNVAAVAAVDPSWRSVPSPYGPLATWFQHFALVVGGGSPLGAVIVFRLVAVAAVAVIGLLAADLAGDRRVAALLLTVLNPLVLLQVISAEHLEGLLCVLLLGAVVAARRGNPILGVVLGCAAGAVKVPGLIAVLAIIAHPKQRPERLRLTGVAIAACAGLTVLVPHGWGWAPALTTPALGYTPGAPASLVGDLIRAFVPWASFDDLAAAGRVAALLGAGCIVAYLTATARRRDLETTVGFGLLAVALLSPVIYPWYLLWGVVCLAPIAQGRLRHLLAVGCTCAAMLALPGLPRVLADSVDAVVAAAGLGRVWQFQALLRGGQARDLRRPRRRP